MHLLRLSIENRGRQEVEKEFYCKKHEAICEKDGDRYLQGDDCTACLQREKNERHTHNLPPPAASESGNPYALITRQRRRRAAANVAAAPPSAPVIAAERPNEDNEGNEDQAAAGR